MLTGDDKNTAAGINAGKEGSNDRFGVFEIMLHASHSEVWCLRSEQLFFFSRIMP